MYNIQKNINIMEKFFMQMELQRLRLDDIQQHPQNVRIHTKRNLDVIKKSLSEWGQYKPILVQKSTMYILAGNGTYQAAAALGWEEMDCNVIDVTDEQAKAILIADNRSSDLSQMDEKAVLDLLQSFDSDLLDLTGYDDKELENMLKFQEGTLFEDQKKKQKKEKKQKKKEIAVSADDQISFVLMGYPFVLADPIEIKQIKDLMDKFTEENIEKRCETTFELWNAIKMVLRDAVMPDENIFPDMGIETDRG